jgi:hypothetical protein
MANFAVMVIGDDPENQLAPYQENPMADCPEEYLPFIDKTEELKKDWEEMSEEEKSEHNNSFESYVEGKGYKKNPTEEKYGYYENHKNINAKWDWHLLGGRWVGSLKLKKGANGQVGKDGIVTRDALIRFADQVIKRDIDFDGMRKIGADNAGKKWDKVNRILGDVEIPYSWEHVREVMFPGDIQAARVYCRNQSANKKIDEWNRKNNYSLFGVDPHDFMNVPREKHCQEAADSAISTFAVLKDGVWYERGKTGWWGIASGENDQSNWNKEISKMIESLGDDTLISIYHCHM